MFLYEKDLKELFWKYYNNKGRAKKYQFECPIREGNAYLLIVEEFQNNYQLNSFEFKLENIKKVLIQAEYNLKYVNKSWIVVPIEKENLIKDRYMNYLKEKKYIGVIGVHEGGRYEIIYQPNFKNEIVLNQPILNLLVS